MATASPTPDHEQARAAVTARYSGLARAARAGQQVTDCDPGPFAAGCFGAAGYGDTGELPRVRCGPASGAATPSPSPSCAPEKTVLDLGSGGGIDVLLSARRVAPGGKAYGLDGSLDMITLARGEHHPGRSDQRGVPSRPHRGHPAARRPRRCRHLQLRDQPVRRQAPRAGRKRSGCSVLAAGSGSATSSPTTALDPAQRAEAEQQTGCTTGTLTAAEYRALLLACGFTSIHITATHGRRAGPALRDHPGHPPAAPPGILIRAMRPRRPSDADQVLAIYQAGLDTRRRQLRDHCPRRGRLRSGGRNLAPAPACGRGRHRREVLGWIAASTVSPRPGVPAA